MIRQDANINLYKHQTNYPDKLCRCPRNLYLTFLHYCILSNYFENSAEYKYKQSIVSSSYATFIHTQTNHPSRRTTQASSFEQTNCADIVRLKGLSVCLAGFYTEKLFDELSFPCPSSFRQIIRV